MRTVAIAFVMIAAAAPCVSGQQPTPPSQAAGQRLDARRTDGAIRVDGSLDEAAWADAEVADGFIQSTPTPGASATERTEIRVLYTETAIYVGARMYDSEPGKIAAQLARRDASGIYSDWLHVVIDSYHDRRTAFRFSVNPKGVKKDVLHFDDSGEDTGWDAVWTAAARMDGEGWVAEYEIPLSQLRFSSAAGEEQVWGVNFRREIARKNERSDWSPIRPDVQGYVSQFGELHGLRGLVAQRQLEVLPYSVARLKRAPQVNGSPYWQENDGGLDVGADLKYGLTSDLTLTATINPDFGQVDADPSEMNLSAYESFFREQRPFFLEGGNIFNFGLGIDDGSGESLFYSRRIGRSPQRQSWRYTGAAEFVDAPETTTILGAAKVSGKTASGWSIGFLDAVTQGESALVSDAGGIERVEPVEPLTNYSVARVARDFRKGRSSVGGMVTALHRDVDEDGPFSWLRNEAYGGGIDVRHRFLENAWEFNGWIAGTHVRGSREAITLTQMAPGRYFQRPDADHVELDTTRTSLSGFGATGWLSKVAGNLRGGVGAHTRSPGFEPNDAGFMSGVDQAVVFGNVNYREFNPGKVFRFWSVGMNPSASWDYGGSMRHQQVNLFGGGQLLNFWGFNIWSSRAFGGNSNDALRGGPSVVYPGAWRGNFNVYSDSRKPVTGNFGMFVSRDDDTGAKSVNAWSGANYRPSGRIELSMSPSLSTRESPFQYVAQLNGSNGREYLFGAIDQKTISVTTRLSYTFTPELSLQLYAQPFVSAGEYSDFVRVVDPHAARFEDRVHRFAGAEIAPVTSASGQVTGYRADADGDGVRELGFGNPDFNFKQLRSNMVLRWQYRPGSTLFVVWGQGRTDYLQYDGSFGFGRDVRRLVGADSGYRDVLGTNVFLVKMNYWLDL